MDHEPQSTDEPYDPAPPGPPTKHELALMIWMAVFPTLIALNLILGSILSHLNLVLRTFVLVSLAVPVVIYALMPRLHRSRDWLIRRRGI